jgi:hypothetical protein
MLDIILKNQNLVILQALTFSVLFGTVLIVTSIVYTKTTVYSTQKQEKSVDVQKGVTGFFEKMSDRKDFDNK